MSTLHHEVVVFRVEKKEVRTHQVLKWVALSSSCQQVVYLPLLLTPPYWHLLVLNHRDLQVPEEKKMKKQ